MLQIVLALAFASVPQQQPEVSYSYLGIDGKAAAKRNGVVVVELDEHSPAEAAGIRIGDVILTLDGRPVRSFESLMTAVEERTPGQIVSIDFQREAESGRVMVELADLRPLCEEGSALTCSFLAARYYNADYEGEARRLATIFYDKACNLGYLQACSSLGMMHRFGSGVPKDLSRAAALFERACNADLGYACLSLAEAYSDGEGVEKNPARALELFERSCALDTNYACFSLGLMYERALDVPRDWLAAGEYYRRGCELGWDLSCEYEWHVSRHSPRDEEEPKTFPDATPELNAALVDAVREGEVDDVRRLLDEGADPTIRADYGSMRDLRLVKLAIYKEQPEIVRMLIDAGVGIEDKDRMNTATPLTAAIGQGHMETVEVLLELGARVRRGDLGSAAGYGTPGMIRRLMELGPAADDLYSDMTPAIKHAAEMKRLENIEFLVEHGADIDALDKNDHHTALTFVVERNELDTAALLLTMGADPDVANGEGTTAFQYAVSQGNWKAVALMLEHGAHPDGAIENGLSALQMAAVARHREVIRGDYAHDTDIGTEIPDEAIVSLIDAYGLRELTSRFASQLRQTASTDFGISEQVVDGALGEVLLPDSIFPFVEEALRNRLDEKSLAEYQEFLQLPLVARIVHWEKTTNARIASGATLGASDGERLEPADRRRQLLESLDMQLGTSDMLTELKVELARTLISGHQSLIPSDMRLTPEAIVKQVQDFRPHFARSADDATRETMARMYRSVSDDELHAYLSSWRTPVGEQLSRAVRDALFEGFLSIGEPLSEAYETTMLNVVRRSYRAPVVKTKDYEYTAPNNEWVQISRDGPDSLAATYANLSSRMLFEIRTRNHDEPNSSNSDYGAAILLLHSRSSESHVKLLSQEDWASEDVKGVLTTSEVVFESGELSKFQWTCESNDTVYELTVYAAKDGEDPIREHVNEVLSGFRLRQ